MGNDVAPIKQYIHDGAVYKAFTFARDGRSQRLGAPSGQACPRLLQPAVKLWPVVLVAGVLATNLIQYENRSG